MGEAIPWRCFSFRTVMEFDLESEGMPTAEERCMTDIAGKRNFDVSGVAVYRCGGSGRTVGRVLQQPRNDPWRWGQGTMSPDALLRVLGPKPVRIAYAQPSRKAANGWAVWESPNRFVSPYAVAGDSGKPPPEQFRRSIWSRWWQSGLI